MQGFPVNAPTRARWCWSVQIDSGGPPETVPDGLHWETRTTLRAALAAAPRCPFAMVDALAPVIELGQGYVPPDGGKVVLMGAQSRGILDMLKLLQDGILFPCSRL